MSAVRTGTARIWHQSMATLSEFGPYQDLLRQHIAAVVPDGVNVDIHGAQAKSYGGQPPANVLKYPYLKHLIQAQSVAACRQAEAEGYDAVAMATFGDPYLRECRSMVDIPVATMPESCLFIASSLAARCALICLAPASIRRVSELIHGLGISVRVSGVYALEPAVSEHDLVHLMSARDLGELNGSLTRLAAQAAADGAELLIPAEGALNELLWSQRITSVSGLPVLDGLGVTLEYALMLTALRQHGAEISRVSTYAKPPAELLDSIETALRQETP